MIVACAPTKNTGVAQTKSVYASDKIWRPHDGMSPPSVSKNYLQVPFMPVTQVANEKAMKIAGEGSAANIFYSVKDAKVVEIAAQSLAKDIQRVSGIQPALNPAAPQGDSAILIGTLGQSPLIDQLYAEKKLNLAPIAGKWEAYTAAVVENPLPGLSRALVIAGSDRRGTAYGVFALSEAMGVSPWYFWGDIPPVKQSKLYISGSHTQASPAIKYRGIFLNDEDWGLMPWAAKTFEAEQGNIGPKTYATIFELLLRLQANMIWPAMHEFPRQTTPFYLLPENKIVADNYAIVIGTSHHEPMLRNSHEFKPDQHGVYDYWQNRDRIYQFWRERVQQTATFENIYTIGMRGRTDLGMLAPEGASDADKAAKIQNQIIPDQRQLLRDYVHHQAQEVPQIFIPYKETLVQYRSGLQLPDDVTIVWPDDNHGYIRQLSNREERKRSGGSGVYYHLSYWGVPSSYLWLMSTPPGMTYAEMIKAWDSAAHNLWLVNVGDIKPHEIGTEFFLRLARNPEAFRNFDPRRYLTQWAERSFGAAYGEQIAYLLAQYYQLNIVKRPEHLGRGDTSGFSLTANGDQAQQRLNQFAHLNERANAVYEQLSSAHKSAFYAMILFPIRSSYLVNKKVLLAERSRLWARQKRAATNPLALEATRAQKALLQELEFYNEVNADGKWQYMMSPMSAAELPGWAHETQRFWAEPAVASYNAPDQAILSAALEGSAANLSDEHTAALPLFNKPANSRYFIDVFNQGARALAWRASSHQDWIILSQAQGDGDSRIFVTIDWSKLVSPGRVSGMITLKGAGQRYRVQVDAVVPSAIPENLPRALENNRRVVIEAEAFSEKRDVEPLGWKLLKQAAASGDAMTVYPLRAKSIAPQQVLTSSPSMTYTFYCISTGSVKILTQALPTHPISSDQAGQRYAISLNGEPPKLVDVYSKEYSKAWGLNTLRAAALGETKHQIHRAGLQTLQVWMVDTGVVVDKFTVDFL